MRYPLSNRIPFSLGIEVQETTPAELQQEIIPPAPASTPSRVRGTGVEIRDAATGKFVENAKVSPLDSRGVTFTTKTTGPDGKALFGESDVPEAPSAYRIEAEGYKTVDIPFESRTIIPVQLEAVVGPLGIPVWGWAIGGLAAVGLIVYIAKS